jgi:hypothetical protein
MKNRKRREAALRGKIEIRKPVFNLFCKKHSRFDYYRDEWDYRHGDDAVYIPLRRFATDELDDLIEIMQESSPIPRAVISMLTNALAVIRKPEKVEVKTLIEMEAAARAYIQKNIVEGWIFVQDKASKLLEPYLVEAIYYTPTERSERVTIPAHTTLRAIRYEKDNTSHVSFEWHSGDLGKSVDLLLLDEGIYHETADLVRDYYEREKVFLKWRGLLGTQFLGNGNFQAIKDGWREYDSDMHNTRIVVDDKAEPIERHRGTGLFQEIDGDEDIPALDPEAANKFTRLPLAFHVWCFNLDSHREGWVHIDHMKKYVYKPELREKLILPNSHEDLIDALTGDMDVLMEDIVSGKSGGTTILCQGKAGTGKTLTAEIYAEVVKRPLYRVHSGQLGTEAGEVEAQLKEALTRSKRWGAVMLIDEADVFVMERGTDLQQNAVCGVFLRILEYFDGLLFLTTNRADTVDDAILSRCIAHIKFDLPNEQEREKLWRTLGEVYGIKLTEKSGMALRLSKAFPNACGRDIKGLIRLAIKYARRKNQDVKFETIKRLATFKGL